MYINAASPSDIRDLQDQIDDLVERIRQLEDALAPRPKEERRSFVQAADLLPGEIACLPARKTRFCKMGRGGPIWVDQCGGAARSLPSPHSAASVVQIVDPSSVPAAVTHAFAAQDAP